MPTCLCYTSPHFISIKYSTLAPVKVKTTWRQGLPFKHSGGIT